MVDPVSIQSSTRAPMITLGSEFFEQPLKEQVAYLHKLASAMNHAADVLQKERDTLLVEKSALDQQLLQAQSALGIQKMNMVNAITGNNSQAQDMAKRIQELEYRVKTQDEVIKGLNE